MAVAAADVTLRRDGAFDLALPFLGAALLRFWDFSMERVDMFWAPLVRGAGIDARTTQSPANRGASPNARRWPASRRRTSMRTMRRKSSRFRALKSGFSRARFRPVHIEHCGGIGAALALLQDVALMLRRDFASGLY